jgi:hypothetical protein
MKNLYSTVVLSLTCLFGLGGSALARDNAHSVEISDVVQIGDTKLKPGYKVEGQGAGPVVQVSFPAEREHCVRLFFEYSSCEQTPLETEGRANAGKHC